MKSSLLISFLLALFLWPLSSDGLMAQETFVVNSSGDDPDDDIGDDSCKTSSGVCTLRAAIQEANADPVQDEITFSFQGATTIAPQTPLPAIEESIDLDGASFDNASCPTQSNPANLLITLTGQDLDGGTTLLRLESGADFSVIRGLNLVEAGYGIYLDAAAPNFLDGVEIICNHIGTNNNSQGLGNRTGIQAQSGVRDLTIGGTSDSDRNVISSGFQENNLYGQGIVSTASTITIEGNFVGTTVDGSGDLGNQGLGIFTQPDMGWASIKDNIIAFNGGDGIVANSFSPANGTQGIEVVENEIHHNLLAGIDIGVNTPGFSLISQNNISDNGGLGIEGGLNNSFIPKIKALDGSSDKLTLDMSVFGGPFTIEVFHNDSCDPSGNGEGQEYVESFVAPFGVSTKVLSVPIPQGKFLSLTATNNSSRTSSFSLCVPRLLFVVDTNIDLPDAIKGDGVCAASNGDCSLRAAIQETNHGPLGEQRTIGFDLSNSLILIGTLGPLPTIRRPIVMDGTVLNSASCASGDTDIPTPVLRIDAVSGFPGGDGLVLAAGSDGSLLQGIEVNAFIGDGIKVESNNNQLYCISAGRISGNWFDGIQIDGNNNDLGGVEDWQRIYSGKNGDSGIAITGNFNNVLNSFVGNDGANAHANEVGVLLDGAASFNSIGSYTVASSQEELGPNVISGNTEHGIHSRGSGGFNSFGGNLVGLAIDGTSALGNGNAGIYVESPNATVGQSRGEGGLFYETPNVVVNNVRTGIAHWGDNGLVKGNYTGVTKTSVQMGNLRGIYVLADDTKVEDNYVAGNLDEGILLVGSNNEIYGNWIGRAPNGSSAGNGGPGISIGNGTGNLIGNRDVSLTQNLIHNNASGILIDANADYNRVETNEIHDNTGKGISVHSSSEKNFFALNTFDGNGGMAIDLNNDGAISPNDSDDADSGGNDLMNRMTINGFPGNGSVSISFSGEPDVSHFYEVYAMDSCPASNLEVEGQTTSREFIQFTTDSNGNWNGLYTNPALVTLGVGITALVSNSFAGFPGSTSEFANCRTVAPPAIPLKVFAWLSGPYENSSVMNTGLAPFLPNAQPYDVAPWNYQGTETLVNPSVTNIDWVLVELRSTTSASSVVARKAGILVVTGEVRENSLGTMHIDVDPGDYYVVLHHRNHLSVMSASPVTIGGASTVYNFTTSESQAFGTNPMVEMDTNEWALWGGDGNSSNDVTAFDFLNVWLPQNGGSPGYHQGDFNMSGSVTAFDFLNVWLLANGRSSQVP